MSDGIQRTHSKPRCLVVGGAGFLGGHLVEDLISRGYKVSIFDLKHVEPTENITSYQGDICDMSLLKNALKDCEIVFNCAAAPPVLGFAYWAMFNRVHIQGTEALIRACKESGVRKLVHTSTAFVVYNGDNMVNGNEQLPYSTKPLDNYIASKVLQEQIVLRANSTELMTCAIRPNGMFGPRDPYTIPGIITTGRYRNMFIIGSGNNLIDFTYVRNVTHGLILAGESLCLGSSSCGAAYNVTNDSPILFWEFVSRILKGVNLPVPTIHFPSKLMYLLSLIIVTFCWLISPFKQIIPVFTPVSISFSSKHVYSSCEKAKRELGYTVKYSMDEGIQASLEYFKNKH